MLDPQISALFTAAVTDPRFPAAIAIAVVAGLVRGFSGFGSALLYIPLISALYSPRIAVATLLMIDSVCALPFAVKAVPICSMREVAPMTVASAAALPLGALVLLLVDAQILRWAIAVLVLIALATLISGWRYRTRPTMSASLGVGALSGLSAGAVGIGAPPLLIFWLGGGNSAATVRANFLVYFILQDALSLIVFYFDGLLTAQAILLALLLGSAFAIAIVGGAVGFRLSNESFYRRVAYVITGLSVLISLPIFDAWR